jgi:ribosomal protein L16 Arg81 hydroxylase
MLTEWRTVARDRDNRARRAVSAWVGKHRMNQLTGIGRPTIDRILAAYAPAGTSIGHHWPSRRR